MQGKRKQTDSSPPQSPPCMAMAMAIPTMMTTTMMEGVEGVEGLVETEEAGGDVLDEVVRRQRARPVFRTSSQAVPVRAEDRVLSAAAKALSACELVCDTDKCPVSSVATAEVTLLQSIVRSPHRLHWRVGFSRVLSVQFALLLSRTGLDANRLATGLGINGNGTGRSEHAVAALFRIVHMLEDDPIVQNTWEAGMLPNELEYSMEILSDVSGRVLNKVLMEMVLSLLASR